MIEKNYQPADIEAIMGEPISERLKKRLAEFDLRFTEITPQERDQYILETVRALVNPEIKVAGEHRIGDWERGWGENFDLFRQTGNPDAAVPLYFGKHPIVRWRRRWVRPVSESFDYRIICLLVEFAMERYMKEAAGIYEFGCGPGYHLLRARQINPTAHLVGLDWTTASQKLLNGMADTAVQLLIQPPGSKTTLIETVVPITQQQAAALSYARWVAGRKALVDQLSGGRLGYVHLPAMDLASYQRAYGEVIGDCRNKEALVIDVRYNAGGNLHDQLITLFTGEVTAAFVNRDTEVVGRIPSGRWARPTALVQNAASYSDGSIFPHLYRRQKLGPVIGDRVPGTGTAAWWLLPMKGALKWGIPQLGARDFKTGWFENQEIVPDLAVANDPAALAAGRDPQLEAAVTALLRKLPRR